MLDEKDLRALDQLMARRMGVLIESDILPKFDLLAEGQAGILDRLDRMDDQREDMEVMDARIAALEATIKKLNREVAALKKAN